MDEPKERKTMSIPKIPKQEYTAEFKEQAVKHAQAVGIVVAASEVPIEFRLPAGRSYAALDC